MMHEVLMVVAQHTTVLPSLQSASRYCWIPRGSSHQVHTAVAVLRSQPSWEGAELR